MNVLVTGGAGYIGSHAVQRLLRDGHTVVALDNLFRGHAEAMERLRPGAGAHLHFVRADVGDRAAVERAIREHKIAGVMHFAAMAYVGESVTQPLVYYRNNAVASLALIEACDACGVEKFVFSSTCATYGEPGPKFIPIPETCPQSPINPYGWSKLHVERMLLDYAAQARRDGKKFAFAALRYFNVAGCDRSGVLGEHHEPETHLIPVVLQTVLGQRESVTIFGTDYPTPDGTCIRDYVHVEDLIDAHVAVMNALNPGDERVYNLGIGEGRSVREILDSVRRVTGVAFKVKEGARRPGDPPRLFADPRKIKAELDWRARMTDLDETVRSAWEWFRANPRGYAG
jgi:UDP-glucose 4-epimerase